MKSPRFWRPIFAASLCISALLTTNAFATELGILAKDLPPGVRVVRVIPNSPAASQVSLQQPYRGHPAGTMIAIEPGDLIVEINGVSIASEAAFANAVDTSGPVMMVRITNLQDGNSYLGSVQLAASPRFGVTAANFPRGVRVDHNTKLFYLTLIQPSQKFPVGTQIQLESGDVITHVNSVPVRNNVELKNELVKYQGPVTLAVTNLRDGQSYVAKTMDLPGPIPPVPPKPFPVGQRAGDPLYVDLEFFSPDNSRTSLLPPTKMPFRWCPPTNSFLMGSPQTEPYRDTDENQVPVGISKGYWIGETEVTQAQWKAVMGATRIPWLGQFDAKDGQNFPATYISWYGATHFCRMLTDHERRAGRLPADWEFTLPTEAEWEYACRAGTKTMFSFGNDPNQLPQYAWYRYNVPNNDFHPREAGTKLANAWSIKDMHGNVREWCWDLKGTQLTGGIDPQGPPVGLNHVQRGGGFNDYSYSKLRSAERTGFDGPAARRGNLGFRVAIVKSRAR